MDADRRRIVGAIARSPLPARRFAYPASHLGRLGLFEHVTRYEDPLTYSLKPAYELSMYGAWFARHEKESIVDSPIGKKSSF